MTLKVLMAREMILEVNDSPCFKRKGRGWEYCYSINFSISFFSFFVLSIGQWVGKTQKPILDLLNELGLETYPQYAQGKTVHWRGKKAIRKFKATTTIPPVNIFGNEKVIGGFQKWLNF